MIAVLAVAIRLESRGNPIYTQTRVGRNGAPFEIYKLRTMVSGAERIGEGLRIAAGDARITRLGAWLRRLSLDELPNLWNVLRGEMSIIGPRPTLAFQVEQYTDHQRRRLEVNPGITGWAQVNGRASLPWSERIELDIWYVEHRSLRLDLTILARTVRQVFSGEDLYRGERGGWQGPAAVGRLTGQPTPPYRKHDDDEAFLEWLNGLLAGPEADGYEELEERHPTVHVLGLPRSGTTLALQLIAAHTDIAYVDHVAAAFPRAPMVGLRLAQKLRRGLPRTSSYASDFGRTASLTEPHEFTYFWSRLLDLPYGLDGLAQPEPGHQVDWDRARRVLTNMCAAVDGPLAFKSFHVIWQLEAFCRAAAAHRRGPDPARPAAGGAVAAADAREPVRLP